MAKKGKEKPRLTEKQRRDLSEFVDSTKLGTIPMFPQEMVERFMKKHRFPRNVYRLGPGVSSWAYWQTVGMGRMSLMGEELSELAKAWGEVNIVEVADALADLLYVVYGTAVAAGIDIESIFREVHHSNMTKRVDGAFKPKKGVGYRAPNIAPLLKRQGLKT